MASDLNHLERVIARAASLGVSFGHLPSWAPMTGITLGKNVLVKPGYEDHAALIEHELVHVVQQARDGWKFFWRYATSAWWRVAYEAEAYRTNIANGDMTVESAARLLSGKLYWNACSYEQAVLLLDVEVKEAA